MIDAGSRELGWRIQEAAPDAFFDVHRELKRPFTQTAVDADLARMDMRSPYVDVLDMIGVDRTHLLTPSEVASKPVPAVRHLDREVQYDTLTDERVICIGAGAGSLLLASYFCKRGVPEENVTIIDPRGRDGGIWTEDWAQFGGFNNPVALNFGGYTDLSLYDRRGINMLDYLRRVSYWHTNDAHRVHDMVVDMRRERRGDREWVARTVTGETYAGTSVLLATGTPHPKRIDGPRIASNLDEAPSRVHSDQLIVERYQRRLTDEELRSGRPIVLIGLGNSTAAMLNQIQDYEDRTRTSVNYTVVTDHSELSVYVPTRSADIGSKSIFRKPKEGYLTGYSGDLPRDRQSYNRMLNEGRVITDVSRVYFDEEQGELRVQSGEWDVRFGNPHVFALIGYDRDNTLFKSMGALDNGWFRRELTVPAIRPGDGAVHTRKDGYMSNVYAAGSAAATPANPNAAVVPGIQAQAPRTMLTVAVRNAARQVLAAT